ncbi:MAG: hypothetical protein JOY80_08865 [Candidatus Dormibacteraeota bacterium]|nr:hypothetical protein [Candidatus Dormibacteraeota bacterium]
MQEKQFRRRAQLIGYAGISAGVAFLAIYAVSDHPLYRLILGIGCLALGGINLVIAAR